MARKISAASTDRRLDLVEELLDEMIAWNPRERFRMLGAWRDCGVSLAQANVITLLEMGESMSMGRVAELLGVSVASATGIVDRMEERGLVVRLPSPTDRRVVEVHIGDAARDLFGQIRDRRREYLRTVLQRVDEQRLLGLLEGLRAVRNARAEIMHEQAQQSGDALHDVVIVRARDGVDVPEGHGA